MLEGLRDRRLDELTDEHAAGDACEVDDLVPARAPLEEPGRLAGPLHEDLLARAHERREVRLRLRLDEGEKAREPGALLFFRDVVAELERGRVRPGRVLEAEET